MEIEQLIKEKKGTIVDVRTTSEFMGGHASSAVNIPLQEISNKVEELKKLSSPLLLCCASGGRSGQAQHFLQQHGIECYNVGSWLDVNYYQTKN